MSEQEQEQAETPAGGNGAPATAPDAADAPAKIPLALRVYGVICIVSGASSLVANTASFAQYLVSHTQDTPVLSNNPLLRAVLVVLGIMLSAVGPLLLVFFGASLVRNRRRNAGQLTYALIGVIIVQIIVNIMSQGMGWHLAAPLVQLGILIALSATVDPALRLERELQRQERELKRSLQRQERELQRRLEEMIDRDAALEGLLGRDASGEGYIKLNFFNLFWVFVICSFLGLVLEEIWHMVVVEPGVYQDRAGVLFGPFSPIYGCGCVIMTMALNRFYKKNFLLIFAISAVLGAGFEVFSGWFLQTSFGVVSWSYSHITLFGAPDPLVLLTGGRTCTYFACMWGLGGLIWIKLLLPRVLKIINLIPWKWRYSLTTVCTVLMLADCFMTLQSLDCWYKREAGTAGSTAVETFYAEHFDNAYMENRFQSMSMDAGTGTAR